MHPAAWLAWAMTVMVLALMTTNPLYLAVLLLCVLFVATLAPRTETGVAGFRVMLIAGVSVLAISVFVATINGAAGERTLFTLPGPDLPSWMGGLRLGGPVTAEALAGAAIRGLAILCVFLAFAIFNGAVSPYRVLRLGPAALFHAGLVVTIGLRLLPATVEDLRRLREMRALRGAGSGVRDLPVLVVPAIIGGLERAMRFAEAMEARGYASPVPLPRLGRLAGLASVPLALAAGWWWLYSPGVRILALALFTASLASLSAWAVLAARARRATRMRPEPFPASDRAAVVASLAVIATAITTRATGWMDLGYNPFAGLPVPAFEPAALAIILPVLWPVALLLRPAQSSVSGHDDALALPGAAR